MAFQYSLQYMPNSSLIGRNIIMKHGFLSKCQISDKVLAGQYLGREQALGDILLTKIII